MARKKVKNITVGELLQKLSNMATVESRIATCSVGLVKIPGGAAPGEPDLIGSGTLARIGDKYGILTAQHVLPHLMKESTEFGVSILPYAHRYTISVSDVHVVELPKLTKQADRPDIAFMFLTGSKLGAIQAKKSFWSIPHWRDRMLLNPVDKYNSLWLISGCPGEFTKTEKSYGQFKTVKSFCNMLGCSGVEREYFDQEFDYLEVSVLYQEGCGLPETFGGVSGGGLWQIPITESENGMPQGGEPLLSGVACWETNIKETRERSGSDVQAKRERWILCHGPHSVYQKLCELVEQEYSH